MSQSYSGDKSIIAQENKLLRERLDKAEAKVNAAAKVCEIYFNIAAEVIGEDEVRKRRDTAIAAQAKP